MSGVSPRRRNKYFLNNILTIKTKSPHRLCFSGVPMVTKRMKSHVKWWMEIYCDENPPLVRDIYVIYLQRKILWFTASGHFHYPSQESFLKYLNISESLGEILCIFYLFWYNLAHFVPKFLIFSKNKNLLRNILGQKWAKPKKLLQFKNTIKSPQKSFKTIWMRFKKLDFNLLTNLFRKGCRFLIK